MIILSTAVNTTGPTVRVPNSPCYTYRPVQIDVTGAGTVDVAVQGRVDGNSEWVELFASSTTAIEMVAVLREFRAVTTNVVGSVNVRVALDVKEQA